MRLVVFVGGGVELLSGGSVWSVVGVGRVVRSGVSVRRVRVKRSVFELRVELEWEVGW